MKNHGLPWEKEQTEYFKEVHQILQDRTSSKKCLKVSEKAQKLQKLQSLADTQTFSAKRLYFKLTFSFKNFKTISIIQLPF